MEFQILHRRALAAVRKLFTAEIELLDLFNAIEAGRGFEALGFTSLFGYATEELGLSEDCAYKLIRVARKSHEVPALRLAIGEGSVTVSKAVVIAPVINRENADHWIELAATLPKRELERLVADVNPAPPGRERAREQGNGFVKIEVSVTTETHALIQRAQELVAQKKGLPASMADTFQFVLEQFVRKEDPVQKAERNNKNTGPGASAGKGSKPKEPAKQQEPAKQNKPAKPDKPASKNLSAAAVHAVHARDQGRCQKKLRSGQICGERKWIDIHHIVPSSEGGSDEPENLITLCCAHHRMEHKKHKKHKKPGKPDQQAKPGAHGAHAPPPPPPSNPQSAQFTGQEEVP